MLTTTTILNAVQQRIHDDSDTMRNRLLSYLNDAIQAVWLERDWSFLITTDAALSIASGVASKPADYGKLLSCKSGDDWYLDKRHHYIDEDAWRVDNAFNDTDYPTGWSADSTSLYFWPSSMTDATATLRYIKVIPEYADSETTLLPDYFRTLMVRTVMNSYYEFEADERMVGSVQLDQQELYRINKHENLMNPQPVTNYKYLRAVR